MTILLRVTPGAFMEAYDGAQRSHIHLQQQAHHSLLAPVASPAITRALLAIPCGCRHSTLFLSSPLSPSLNSRANQGAMFMLSCSSSLANPGISAVISCQGGSKLLHPQTLPSPGLLPLPSRALKSELILSRSTGSLTNVERFESARCFRDDDAPYPDQLTGRDPGELGQRARMELAYSPWAMTMMEGLGRQSAALKESTGGPSGGGGKGDGDGDGDGGGGGGDGEGEEHIYLLPILTLAFAALHLGYCLAIWLRGDGPEGKFGTGLGLFGLLFLAACRLEHRTGIDAYILGLGASVGSLVWSGERWYVRREVTLAGILACFAAGMAAIFTAALYHSL